MKILPVTAVILTHRHDQLFEQAVASVAWADQIMIIDNQSGIDHQKYAHLEQFIITVIPKPILDFALIRNQALITAKQDWVFFLDSDELFPTQEISKIAALIDDQTKSGAVFFRSDVFYGKTLSYGEAGHQPIIRMMKKAKAKFINPVHEIAQVSGELKHVNLEILHYAHPSISEFVVDVTRYAKMAAQNSASTSVWQNLLELIIFPPTKLLFSLLCLGGLADGWRGMIYASCMSLHSLLVRIYRYEEMANQNKPSPS